MSFKEVTQLRKSGQLEKALEMAEADLRTDPDNDWAKRAVVWVYYEYLKKAQAGNRRREYQDFLEKIVSLDLPPGETYVFDSVAWSVGKFLFHYPSVDTQLLNELFETIRELPFSKPGDAYSFLLKAFKKHSSEWNRFPEFMEWWGYDNFSAKDYENFITDEGRKLPSLVESVIIGIARTLLKTPVDKGHIKAFLPEIARVSEQYTNMQYPPYYYAKMLIELGDRERFMDAFLPFARKKQREFWVWNLMSENFDADSDEYFSCLCKSASCDAPEKFIGEVREKLAVYFLKKKMYPEAKFEMQRIIEIRKQEGWPLQNKHRIWQSYTWWETTRAVHDNRNVYQKNAQLAESLLYANIPEEIIMVTRVNKEKKVLSFIASKERYGHFSYRKAGIDPGTGETYAVRFNETNSLEFKFYKPLSVIKTTREPGKDIVKSITGKIEIRPGNSFGFLNNVFVPQEVINRYKLKNADEVKKAVAVLSYNKKHRKWGWIMIKIEK